MAHGKLYEELDTLRQNLSEDQEKDFYRILNEIISVFKAGHEETAEALIDPVRYRAFVESITAEDLRRIDVTEASIEDFFSSSLEERQEAINNLPYTLVYELYEGREHSRESLTQLGSMSLEMVRNALLESIAQKDKLQPLGWIVPDRGRGETAIKSEARRSTDGGESRSLEIVFSGATEEDFNRWSE